MENSNNNIYTTYNYFCTWAAQNFVDNHKNVQPRDMITEEFIFGENGLALQFPNLRKHLIFVLDDGWDVGFGYDMGRDRHKFGSLIVNEERFPSCDGAPQERLKKLHTKITDLGWQGLGLWVCANGCGEKEGSMFTQKQAIEYWTERLMWCKYAEIAYLKIDWGHYERSVEFRKMLTELAKKVYPQIVIENAGCVPPFNGAYSDEKDFAEIGRFITWKDEMDRWTEISSFSQVFRSYDVSESLSVPTTLDRVYGLLKYDNSKDNNCIINCEDEMYIGAVLGCSIGIMRSSLCNPKREHGDVQKVFKRIDEVHRAINWQTYFAPPVASNLGDIVASDEILCDSHDFSDGTIWIDKYFREISQGAPAIIARSVSLPEVTVKNGIKPYVVASRNPNGAYSVATLQRKIGPYDFFAPKAEVLLELADFDSIIGVFGFYDELILKFDFDMSDRKILAKDLISVDGEFNDITDLVRVENNTIIISGDLLTDSLLYKNSYNDVSAPGIVIKIL